MPQVEPKERACILLHGDSFHLGRRGDRAQNLRHDAKVGLGNRVHDTGAVIARCPNVVRLSGRHRNLNGRTGKGQARVPERVHERPQSAVQHRVREVVRCRRRTADDRYRSRD